MRTFKVVIILMLAVFTQTFAQSGENAILGIWESDAKDVRMELFKQGGKYYGRYLWGKTIVESDGVTSKKDIKNPDPKLRTRNVVGITSLTGLTWDGEEFTDGKIYDAPSGDTYDCKIWIKNDKLYLRGYMGISLLGKTVSWHRYSPAKK